jgi:ribosomal protein S18 acetylase RimI-like enzyme
MEEFSFNAWPSLRTLHYDGWLLRFSESYTRRANSVNPIYTSTLSLDEKINYCESAYQEHGQRTIFKMTDIAKPEELDARLAGRGYAEDARTSVQICELKGIPMPSDQNCFISETLTDDWLDSFCELNHVSDKRRGVLGQILLNILPQTAYIVAKHNDSTVAVGMGVMDGDYLGIYNLVTAEDFRRRGIGTELLLHLLDWGIDNAATTAYLQVMLNNEPALKMYERLGFRELYQYWYRVQGD